MKININPVISSRIRQAWSKLSQEQQNRIAPMLARANQQALAVAQTRNAPPLDPTVPHQALLARSAISHDLDPVISNLEAGSFIEVGPGGEIWGTGKYEQFDPGWTESIAVWMEQLLILHKHAFNPGPPAPIAIPDTVQIAIAGDWGTGDWRSQSNPAPSTDVTRQIGFLHPDVTIHLGDVYYAGTTDEERHLLSNLWPEGRIGALTLNSNHEMYSAATPYFTEALGDPRFAIQQRCSFFALENTNWVIVGLDSAYYSDPYKLYMDGSLSEDGGPRVQIDFLVTQARKGKKVIMLTHHNGLTQDGLTETNLWGQVMSAVPDAGLAYWYWGHVHAGAVYKPYGPAQVRCRCCGHGGVPWGSASVFQGNQNVEWYEKRLAGDLDIPHRVFNGFTVLKLDGTNLKEIFYDENGGVAWSS